MELRVFQREKKSFVFNNKLYFRDINFKRLIKNHVLTIVWVEKKDKWKDFINIEKDFMNKIGCFTH